MNKFCIAVVFLGVASMVFNAQAAAPPVVPIQGYLVDAQGTPLEGGVNLTFSLYVDETIGSPVWSEVQQVQVSGGLFSAYLGQTNALDLALFRDNGDLWLGIAVAGDPEMPRLRLGSAPFSGYAEYSGSVGVPAGLIGIFDTSCPAGWTRVAALDGAVIRGGATYGASGGSNNHSHSVDPVSTATGSDGVHEHSIDLPNRSTLTAGDHNHNLSLSMRSINHSHSVNPPGTSSQDDTPNHTHAGVTNGPGFTTGVENSHVHNVNIAPFDSATDNPQDQYASAVQADGSHQHSINHPAVNSTQAGAHTHPIDLAAFDSANATNWPPYVAVVFCKKDVGRTGIRTHRSGAMEDRLARVEEENQILRRRLKNLERSLLGGQPVRTASAREARSE